jgi:hypothetical protein
MVKNLARNVMNRQLVNRTVRSKIVSFSIGLMLLTTGVGVSIGAPKKHPEPINVRMIPSKGPEGTNMNSGIIVHITQMDGWHPYRPSLPATTK